MIYLPEIIIKMYENENKSFKLATDCKIMNLLGKLNCKIERGKDCNDFFFFAFCVYRLSEL